MQLANCIARCLQEKEIARMVTLAFGQKVCGFDLLRSERARSFVCDVNGWSFVKNSHKVIIVELANKPAYLEHPAQHRWHWHSRKSKFGVCPSLRCLSASTSVPLVFVDNDNPCNLQYYDDAAGILRSIILSAIAPHRLSMPHLPLPAFSVTPDQVLH